MVRKRVVCVSLALALATVSSSASAAAQLVTPALIALDGAVAACVATNIGKNAIRTIVVEMLSPGGEVLKSSDAPLSGNFGTTGISSASAPGTVFCRVRGSFSRSNVRLEGLVTKADGSQLALEGY